LQELEGYAAIRDPDTGIELACWERVWRSDSLISTDLRAKLLDAAALLETGEPDWHPRSNNQVLDLVHPSLYPIVYNNSLGWDSASQSFKPIPPPEPSPDSSHLSSRFCWLPSDFSVSETGSVMLSSPYINNLDPKAHAIVYPVISSLVEAAVPLWERVLSDLRAPLSPSRIKQESIYYCNSSFYSGYVKSIDCIWKGESPIPDSDEEDEHDEDPDAWYDKRVQDQTVYESLDAYDGALEKTVKKTVSLSRSTIQVIVKLANIILTPEKPEYGGRTWHVEGMQNEHIVSTFIYYYDEENITESQLFFRTGTCQPIYHEQDDNYCMRQLYGISRDDPCVQNRGSVTTSQNRCIAFPNIYQHCVSPFNLVDKTKPGHRKIVALFLVDPTIKIPSATIVPPQQLDLYRGPVMDECPLFEDKLPFELKDRVLKEMKESGGKMSRKEAEEIRLEFMAERTQDVQKYRANDSFFGLRFNMCEH
jgi:hypothetical protein